MNSVFAYVASPGGSVGPIRPIRRRNKFQNLEIPEVFVNRFAFFLLEVPSVADKINEVLQRSYLQSILYYVKTMRKFTYEALGSLATHPIGIAGR